MKYKVNFELELKKNPYEGFYIALEGIDGSGKTTQTEELKKYFEKKGKEVVVTYEPRRTGAVGELIHKVLREDVKLPKVGLQYLFAADRAMHQEELIIPALKAGKVVISDRNFWSGIAYGILDKGGFQKAEDSADQLSVALSVLSLYHQFIAPNITFYLDVNVNTAIDRLSHMGRKAELYEKRDSLTTVQEIYDWMIKKFPGALIDIDGNLEKEEVLKELIAAIEK